MIGRRGSFSPSRVENQAAIGLEGPPESGKAGVKVEAAVRELLVSCAFSGHGVCHGCHGSFNLKCKTGGDCL